ncbi:MAG: ATP-binding SpoIIE family protein phosphatase [Chitinispirillaceae bacterium]
MREKSVGEARRKIDSLEKRIGQLTSREDTQREIIGRFYNGVLAPGFPRIPNMKSAALNAGDNLGVSFSSLFMTPFQKAAVLVMEMGGNEFSASVTGSVSMILFRHYAEKYDNPEQVCKYVKQDLFGLFGFEGTMTFFLGLWNPLTNVVSFCREGPAVPLLFLKAKNEVVEFGSEERGCGHLGVRENIVSCMVNSGDKLLLYTGGVFRQIDARGHSYGKEELKDAFRTNSTVEPDELVCFIDRDLESFRGDGPFAGGYSLLAIEFGSTEGLLEETGFSGIEKPQALLVKNYGDMDNAVSSVLRDMDHNGFPDLQIKQVKICIYEMISNAIRHGNREDFSRNVYVFYKVDYDGLTISVTDEGEGFDYNSIPNPLEPQYRYRDHGRGIFLVRHYMDEVSFNSKGNRILGKKYHEKKIGNRK